MKTHTDNSNQTLIRFLQLEGKRNHQDRDRVERLEHLNKADRQAQVGIVTQDERAGEEGADGQDGFEETIPLARQLFRR